MCRRVFAFVIGLAAAACGRAGSPAPSQPLRLLAAENQSLPLSVRPPGAVHALRLVAGTLRALGRDTLVVSGEFEVGDSRSSRARRSDTLYRSAATLGTFVSELPGMHRDMPIVVPWHLHWEGHTLVVSSDAAGELLGVSGPFRFGPE